MMQIFPSLLAADQHRLEHAIKELEPLCPGFHLDIMDSVFVPNQGIKIDAVNRLAAITYRQCWVHLMVEEPGSYLDQLQLPPDSIVTFHKEARVDVADVIKKILEKKWLPSIAIKPKTSVEEVFPYLESIYQILIMSVEPGFSGQSFLEDTMSKIDPLVGFRNTSNSRFKIAMDGGIGIANIKILIEKGIDQCAIGSELFDHTLGSVRAYQLLSEKIE